MKKFPRLGGGGSKYIFGHQWMAQALYCIAFHNFHHHAQHHPHRIRLHRFRDL